ncbi:uncharacterized protein [Amphiura filiformis]|uniref:uncharacterized protein n=1 Tax=Amphiura filiformis TaxID=82378 RepID=UPI003B2144FF
MATKTAHTPLPTNGLDMNQKCLTQPANVSLQIIEDMDDALEHRTEVVEDQEDDNSPCSADTTDAEVEELSSAASSVGQQQQPMDNDVLDLDSRNTDVVTPPLPEGCKPLSHQVAGHIHGKGKTKAGLLQDCDGAILKPIQTQSRGKKEQSFYVNVGKADVQTNPVLCSIRPLVPRFWNIFSLIRFPTVVYLKIDDVTKKFRKPCIMDVKIGLQSWEDGAPPEKIKIALFKYPYLQTVGFQILGMRVFHPASGEYECQDKYYGRSLDQSKVIEGLARYLNVGENFRVDALRALLDKLEQIKNWFEGQQKYQFYSSSLLLVYEGDVHALTVNGASGDGAITNSASNTDKGTGVVSYSALALNDSESILQASRNLTESSNNVSSIAEVTQGGDSNGYVTRLPSYKESVELARIVQNGTMNGDVTNGCMCRDLKPSNDECKCRKLSQGKSNQSGGINGVKGSQGGGSTKGVTVGQMREVQRRLQQPYNSQLGASSYQGASLSSSSASNTLQPSMENGVSGGSHGKKPILADVKMIDFTHVVDVDYTDENYLVGLRNLIRQFRTLLECHSD